VAPAHEPSLSDNNGNRKGGGKFDDPNYGPHGNSGPDAERRAATPLSAYRTLTLFAMVWILTLFGTLTFVMESRRVHSKDWASVPLQHVLYLSTALLLVSSLTIEFARFSLPAEAGKRCARWLFITLVLGVAFACGQIAAWRNFASRGFYLASNPGSFFFYLITGAYSVLLLGAIIGLIYVAFLVSRLARKET
jgi:cytochrome c oxidase subunit III